MEPDAPEPQERSPLDLESLLVVRPSPWLKIPNAPRDSPEYEEQDLVRHRVESMMRMAEERYGEAIAIFLSFNDLRRHTRNPPDFDARFEDEAKIRRAATAKVAQEMGLDPDDPELVMAKALDDNFRIRVELKSAFPKLFAPNNHDLAMKMKVVLARSFVSTVDSFGRAVEKLEKEAGFEADCFLGILNERLPHVRGVRNTAHHPEDRAHFEGPQGKEIEPGPVHLPPFMIAPGGGPMVQDSLNGDVYIATMADGEVGQVQVGPHSLLAMRDTLLAMYESLEFEENRGGEVVPF